jgi:hypothetical protein
LQLSFTLSSVAITAFGPADTSAVSGGLEVDYTTTVTLPKTVHLLPGEAQSFELFAISTPERSLGSDDYVQKALGVVLEFSAPEITGTLTGVTGSLGFGDFGIGYVNWSGSLAVPCGNNGRAIVTLSDTVFGLDHHMAHVIATIAYDAAQTGIEIVELRPELATVHAFKPGLTAVARSGNDRKKS